MRPVASAPRGGAGRCSPLLRVLCVLASVAAATAQDEPTPSRGVSITNLKDLHGIRSTQNCTKVDRLEHVVCVYEDLILFNGTVYFLSDDPLLSTQPVHVALRLDEPGGLRVYKPTKVSPLALPFDWRTVQKFEVRDAVLNYIPSWPSMLNMMGEYLPSLHTVLCEHLGRCAYADRKHTVLVTLNPEVPAALEWGAAVADAFACLSVRPPLWLHHADLASSAFVVRRGVMGYGPTCRVDNLHCTGNPEMPGFARGPAAPGTMASWVARMNQCVGLDPDQAVDADDPRFTLVDRDYRSGRHVLNVDEVLRALRLEVGARSHLFPTAFRALKLEGLPLRPQARAFHDATVLVLLHGSGLANAIFLRRNAVLVHVLHQPWFFSLHLYAEAMVAAFGFRDWSLVEVTNHDPTRLSVITEQVTASRYYHKMTPDQRIALLERKQCPPDETVPLHWCALQWVHRATNVQLDGEDLSRAVERGLAMLRAKLGKQHLPFEEAAAAAKRLAEVTQVI